MHSGRINTDKNMFFTIYAHHMTNSTDERLLTKNKFLKKIMQPTKNNAVSKQLKLTLTHTCSHTAHIIFMDKKKFTCFVILNLNGGPSNTPIVLSSQPVTIRNGLAGRKSQELIDFDCPDISPTDVPVSAINTCPNLEAQRIM